MATLTNKREVRENVKQTLQELVDDSVIELEDLKQILKEVSDDAEVPIAASKVKRRSLEKVLSMTKEMHLSAEKIRSVEERLSKLKTTLDAPVDTDKKEPSEGKDAVQQFSDFKSRMAKKREEREKRQRESAPTTVVSSKAYTPSASSRPSPSLHPTSVTAPLSIDPLVLPVQSPSAEEAPPLKVVKDDVVEIPIVENEEEDLYAGLSRYEGGAGRGRPRHGGSYGSSYSYQYPAHPYYGSQGQAYGNPSGYPYPRPSNYGGGGNNFYQQR